MTDRAIFLNVTLNNAERDVDGLVNAIKQFTNVNDVEVVFKDFTEEIMITRKVMKKVREKLDVLSVRICVEVLDEMAIEFSRTEK